MSNSGPIHFISHMRRGMGASRSGDGTITAQVNLQAGGRTGHASQTLSVAGPEHVTALSADQILRTVPEDRNVGFEPNIFAAIEFALPDLPWMMSPWLADNEGNLAPWLVLVVVKLGAGVTLASRNTSVEDGGGGAALSVLNIGSPAELARELPDLSESWAWAHVQTTADLNVHRPADAFADTPELFRARMVCPRRLEPLTDYTACLVPATRGGVRAGLGQTLSGDLHTPAWMPDSKRVELPVYHSWTFQTGVRGDFESLVRKLEPRELTAGMVSLGLDNPGDPRLPATTETTAPFKGALVGTSASAPEWDKGHRKNWVDATAKILDTHRPGKNDLGDGRYSALRDDPVVAPPLWGALKRGETKAPPADLSRNSSWFGTVNHLPEHRAAAGLGAELVRRNQETLMADAWQQAAGLRDVNRVFNQTRLAAEVGKATQSRKLDKISDASALRLAGVTARRSGDMAPIEAAIGQSILPDAFASPALARLTRPRSVVGRRAGVSSSIYEGATNLFTSNPEQAVQFAEFIAPPGLAQGEVVNALGAPGMDGKEAINLVRPVGVQVRPVLGGATLGAVGQARSVQHTITVSRASTARIAAPQTATALQTGRSAMDPAPMLQARLQARIRTPQSVLDLSVFPATHLITPTFPTPVYTYLRQISPDAIMPGVTKVPLNSVGLATINGPFVESVLLGANAELTREMLWREYPADLTGTYMRHFWDVPDGGADIRPIAKWQDEPLGDHLIGPGTDGVTVLLIKGELLARYPQMNIYASKAAWDDRRFRFEPRKDGQPVEQRTPLFGGWLNKSTAFFAFDLPLHELRGTLDLMGPTPGWFFVFEQARTGVQFGLDVPSKDRPDTPSTWADLDWQHAMDDPTGTSAQTHLSLERGVGATTLPLDLDLSAETWGLDAAAQARITYQRPARALIHASAMLP